MKAIGSGGEWWWNLPSLRRKPDPRRRGRRNPDPRGRRRGPPPEPLSSSSESIGQSRGWPIDFPFTQAVTAASLTLTGDTIAQVRRRIVDRRLRGPEPESKGLLPDILMNHDWLRALRMASYGFLLYGPGSHAWYQFLDQCMPKPTFANLSTKVILNQIVLGPCVIGVIFAWNNLWTGKLSELPSKYQNDALPTLLFGFRFWIPVSIINFWYNPILQTFYFHSWLIFVARQCFIEWDGSFVCSCCLHVLLFHFLELLPVNHYEQMKPLVFLQGMYKPHLSCYMWFHSKSFARVIVGIQSTAMDEGLKELIFALAVHVSHLTSWTILAAALSLTEFRLWSREQGRWRKKLRFSKHV